MKVLGSVNGPEVSVTAPGRRQLGESWTITDTGGKHTLLLVSDTFDVEAGAVFVVEITAATRNASEGEGGSCEGCDHGQQPEGRNEHLDPVATSRTGPQAVKSELKEGKRKRSRRCRSLLRGKK